MRLSLKLLFISILFLFLGRGQVLAAQDQFVTVVNPVRGNDFFQLESESPLTNVKNNWSILKSKNLSSTWLLRPDILYSNDALFFKSLPTNQELGIFMEITPTWANQAGVNYRANPNWHAAGSVFLTGYEIAERKKLIDASFEQFKKVFGSYPKSVGAWWIDAGSLSYMREKYGIVANMDVADQYTTDNYQVWGQYFSLPFYPSSKNALIPAPGKNESMGVVTIQWATRDPFNSYGNGVLDSTYSLQANDYANKKYHNLDIEYFKKLVSIYLDNPYSDLGQVTIGLENDFSWQEFGEEFTKQLGFIATRVNAGTRAVTMSEFARAYSSMYPDVSPPQILFADDPLGSDGKVVWFQNIRYRVGWFYDHRGSIIRDLRNYSNSLAEPCLEKACDNLNLAMTEVRNLDEVTYGDRWIIDEGKISEIRIVPIIDGVDIFYTNQSGINRKLEFVFNDVRVDSKSQPVSFAILEGIEVGRKTDKIETQFNHQLKNGLGAVLLTQFKNLIIFLIFSFIAFYLSGAAILKRASIEHKFILSWPIGMALFTLTAFIFGYLKFDWGIWLLPIISFIVLSFQPPSFNWIPAFAGMTRQNIWTIFLILAGSITWLLTSVKNGLTFDYGLGFWGAHGHDAIWHLSLIESLKKEIPLENPIFSGNLLNNYHYFYDLLLSQTSNWTQITALDLYFRVYPLMISLLIGAVAYLVALQWFRSKSAANLSVFFIYFGGSFGWVLSYIQNKSLGGETLFWAQQAISTLINPPLAVSFVIFLAGLYLFQKVIEQKGNLPLLISLTVLWGTLIEFKAYGGVLVLGSLAIVTLVELIKRNYEFLKISIPIATLSLLVFLPNNARGASLLVFSPFWLIHSMVDFPDRLNLLRLTYARIAGVENKDWFKFISAEVISLIIFIVGNLGTRVVGLLSLKTLLPLNAFNLFILCFLLLSLLLPLLFIQKGANYNIVQFFYYFILIFNFLAAYSLSVIISKLKRVGVVVTLMIICLTLLTTWDTLHHFIPARPPARLPTGEVEALQFLKNQPEGKVLSYYFDSKLRQRYTEPIPLLAYESTPYVSAFSGKPEFIADTVNLEILGVDYKGRLQSQKDVFALREPEVVKKILKENKIEYIYAPKISGFSADEGRFNIRRIFQNSEVEIFKVL